MKKILQFLLLLLIGFVVYMKYETDKKREYIEQLQSKPVSQLTKKEKQDLAEHEEFEKQRLVRRAEAEKEERKRKAEEERKAHEYYLAHKDEIERDKLKRDMHFACSEMPKLSLKYPKTYEEDHVILEERKLNGRPIYFLYIEFSGTNAFGVRMSQKFQCYRYLDDPKAPIMHSFYN
ncbi:MULTISPECIES: hypothetical protein [Xenorhabdus]|uniref:hypothetical protein n=1 Tax=Xenorhabdus TaxID=626 RepID=UPI000649DF6D|nr:MULTISPECIES: hypothetical protein [Xenorhabdus]KLU14528.1 hypothetical protein AAY47_15835 [Xenorhabdus griffiniae]KOP33319.1 hypothetical protein AFK69_10115 [Xenorhabdus sp. GDc328]